MKSKDTIDEEDVNEMLEGKLAPIVLIRQDSSKIVRGRLSR